MIDEMLRDRKDEISEIVSDDDSPEVTLTISGYITKKVLKQSKCKDCEKKLIVHDQDLQNDQVLNFTFKRRFICTTKGACKIRVELFAILDFVEGDLSIGQVTKSAMYVWNTTAPNLNSVANNI